MERRTKQKLEFSKIIAIVMLVIFVLTFFIAWFTYITQDKISEDRAKHAEYMIMKNHKKLKIIDNSKDNDSEKELIEPSFDELLKNGETQQEEQK